MRATQSQIMPHEPLSIDVPYPYPTENYSHLIFGVATNYDRMVDSLPGFSHWLSGTEAQLLVVLTDEEGGPRPKNRISSLRSLCESSGIDVKIIPRRDQTLGVSQYHFGILTDLLEAAAPRTRWIAIIDDDTFFPSGYIAWIKSCRSTIAPCPRGLVRSRKISMS